jgi:hypothetical protein
VIGRLEALTWAFLRRSMSFSSSSSSCFASRSASEAWDSPQKRHISTDFKRHWIQSGEDHCPVSSRRGLMHAFVCDLESSDLQKWRRTRIKAKLKPLYKQMITSQMKWDSPPWPARRSSSRSPPQVFYCASPVQAEDQWQSEQRSPLGWLYPTHSQLCGSVRRYVARQWWPQRLVWQAANTAQ